jgi:hypothetical protein
VVPHDPEAGVEQLVDERLILGNVGRYDLQHVVEAAANRVALKDLRALRDGRLERTQARSRVQAEFHRDEDGEGGDQAVDVHLGVVAAYQMHRLELLQPLVARARRQPHDLRQPVLRDSALGLQRRQDVQVDAVELHHVRTPLPRMIGPHGVVRGEC